MSRHVMLDLETMGQGKDAAIISIGAVRFNPKEDNFQDQFYKTVNLKSAQRAGGKIDAETVLFWMKQNDEARGILCGDDSVLIDTALNEFSTWLREKPLEGLWGNGSDFDNVILEGAYLRLAKTPPWSYKVNRCYRTMTNMYPFTQHDPFKGIKHNALDDAVHQAKQLCRIWKNLTDE